MVSIMAGCSFYNAVRYDLQLCPIPPTYSLVLPSQDGHALS